MRKVGATTVRNGISISVRSWEASFSYLGSPFMILTVLFRADLH